MFGWILMTNNYRNAKGIECEFKDDERVRRRSATCRCKHTNDRYIHHRFDYRWSDQNCSRIWLFVVVLFFVLLLFLFSEINILFARLFVLFFRTLEAKRYLFLQKIFEKQSFIQTFTNEQQQQPKFVDDGTGYSAVPPPAMSRIIHS